MKKLEEPTDIFDNTLFDPHNTVNGMSYDEFAEWVGEATISEIEESILLFANAQMYQHVDIMKICANGKRLEEE